MIRHSCLHKIPRKLFCSHSGFSSTLTTQPSSASSSSSIIQPTAAPHPKLSRKDWLSPNEVLKIFESIIDPISLTSSWTQYSLRRDFKPNEPLLTLLITKLAHSKNFDAIETVMENIKLRKLPLANPLSDDFFYNVIKIYGHSAGRIRKAIETLLDMPQLFNCWPKVKTFNLVLNLLVSAKIFDVARDVYLRAPMLGVEIDACCLNILIKGMCENGDLEGAHKVLDEFPQQRCVPNARTFSTLMHCLCSKGDLDAAFELLGRMEREGVDADTVTFNVVISGLRKQGRIEEGMRVLEDMKGKGCEPNEASYQEVLYGLLDDGRFVEAKEFAGRMVCQGFRPSFVSYKKLIHGICREGLIGEELEWVLKQMMKQGFVPKMGSWKQMVQAVLPVASASQFSLTSIIG
ncbi:Pentatricopeptide repeat-containing protein At3g14580, mitochondrial [Linum grandiflorum]